MIFWMKSTTHSVAEGRRVVESIGGIKLHLQAMPMLLIWHQMVPLLTLPMAELLRLLQQLLLIAATLILTGIVLDKVQKLVGLLAERQPPGALAAALHSTKQQPGGSLLVAVLLARARRDADVVGSAETGPDDEAAAGQVGQEGDAVVAAREQVG